MKRLISLAKQGMKFFGVGVISTLFDWAVFALTNKGFGMAYWLSLIIAFSVGAIINFTLNKKYTFQDKSKSPLQPFVFFSIAGVMLLASLGLMVLLVKYFDPMMARVITTFVVFVLNFILHKFITFGKIFK